MELFDKHMHIVYSSIIIVLHYIYIYIRAVKVNALIYEIIVAEINAIKYFNAVNATLFTYGLL